MTFSNSSATSLNRNTEILKVTEIHRLEIAINHMIFVCLQRVLSTIKQKFHLSFVKIVLQNQRICSVNSKIYSLRLQYTLVLQTI